MTRRLYLEDSHLKTCTSTVESCRPTDRGYDVTLDQTIIFDKAGGQPCDTGSIGDAVILGCDEVNGELLHHIDRPLEIGTSYPVTLNWERRFDHMQQHTGEHLLSYSIYKLFGANNVGFHLSSGYTTIDLDRPLTQEELFEAETLANRFVSLDLSVTAVRYETAEDLEQAGLTLRKQAEGIRMPIRIVSIQDADCCTCCAPHVFHTGEIGSILITESMSYKGGTRVTFLCGNRALLYTQQARKVLSAAGRQFSTSWTNLTESIEKMQEELKGLHKREKELSESLNSYLAEELVQKAVKTGKTTLILEDVGNATQEKLKSLAAKTIRDRNSLTVLFGKSNGRLNYVLSCSPDSTCDVSELCRVVNTAVSGKGGGRGTLAQGTSPIPDAFNETVEQLRVYFRSRLKQ